MFLRLGIRLASPTALTVHQASRVLEVAFDDEEAAFRNVNTRDELAEAARDLPAAAAGAPRG